MNAAGRLETAQHALDMLTARDGLAALEVSEKLEELNGKRRGIQDTIFEEACQQAEELADDRVLVVSSAGWNHGVIGIVASKLVEKYKKPVFIIGERGKEATGSARSFGDFSVDDQKMLKDTKSLFEELGIDIDPGTIVSNLSSSHCQLLEIARAVSSDARVIIMDEPTSSLTDAEAKLLFGIIRKLSNKGVSIVFISHKIDEVLEISEEVTIMRDGQIVGTWPTNELNK